MTNTSGNKRRLPSALSLLVLAACAWGADNARAWKPAEGEAPPAPDAQGVAFPLAFTRENDRCSWDGPAIPPGDRFEIELACDRPDLVRSLTLYLRSGKGWYAAPFNLPAAPASTVPLTRGDFIQEGSPEEWDKIDGVRLAAWKKQAGEGRLTLARLASFRDRVCVIRAGASLPRGEEAVADILARRVSVWLGQAGIGHVLVDEADWLQRPPAQTRFAILPYNPRPTPDFSRAIEAVVRKGGKLLVCYGADPQLAALMGFRLAPYAAAPTPVTWSAYTLAPPAGPVSTVFQESQHLIPALPDKPEARVLAWWENAAGQRQPEAAWLASPAGYWTTHVLESDDASAKTRLLLEWIGDAAPEAWEQAARHAVKRAETASGSAWTEGRRQLDAKAWETVVDAAAERERQLALDRAASQPPAPSGAVAAAWAQPGSAWHGPAGARTARVLKEAGLDRLYLSALSFGRAHAAGALWPRSDMAAFVTDPFGKALQDARGAGLSVHAWITCLNVAQAPAVRLAAWRLAGRLVVTPKGEQTWLTPAHPENAALLRATVEELAKAYPVDGIHLDYIRYPDAGPDLSAAARASFEKAAGPVEQWPADVLPGGARHEAYQKHLAGLVSALVRDLRDRLRQTRPGAELSAAVFPDWPACRDTVLQDWGDWLQTGAVDAVCPMSYTPRLEEFKGYLAAYRGLPGWGARIFPGIGVMTDTGPLPVAMAVDQAAAVQAAGGAGVCWFLANREFVRDYAQAVGKPYR